MCESYSVARMFSNRIASLSLATMRLAALFYRLRLYPFLCQVVVFGVLFSFAHFHGISIFKSVLRQLCPTREPRILCWLASKHSKLNKMKNRNRKKSFRSIHSVTSSFGVPLPLIQFADDGTEWKRLFFLFSFSGWKNSYKFRAQPQLIHLGYYQILSSAMALTVLKMETNVADGLMSVHHPARIFCYRFGCRFPFHWLLVGKIRETCFAPFHLSTATAGAH